MPRTEKKRGRLAEVLMWGFVVLLVAIVGLAVYSHFAPKLQKIPNRVAEGFEQDRINLVLIGVGGDTHVGEGKNLADAIMFVSLKPSTRQVALVSVPRDFYLKIGEYGEHRLNAAHSLNGPALLMESVGQIVGQPVHGFVRVDFAAFEKVVDALGGIDVYVYRPFYDFLFKDGFEQGWQHMNGKRALRYARYRYVRASAEGNNFARELRQQQVLTAIKEKIQKLQPQDFVKLMNVARAVGNHTDTNLTTQQMVELFSMFRNTQRDAIRNVSLKKFTEIIMVRKPGDTGEAVRPIGNDYTTLHRVIRDVFDGKAPIVMRDEIQLTDVGTKPGSPPQNPPQKTTTN
jgi:LCP family protein required for cell wall assembly